MALAQDGATLTGMTEGNTTDTVTASVVLSTSAADCTIYALISAGAQGTDRTQGEITCSGGGLTWTMVAEAKFWESRSAIWSAQAAAPLSAQTITAQLNVGGFAKSVALSVVALTGVDSTTTASLTGDGQAPQVTLAGTRAGAWVFVASTYGGATAPTLTGNFTAYQNAGWSAVTPYAHSWRYFSGKLTNPSSGGDVTLGASAPTTNVVSVTGVEVRPVAVAAGPPDRFYINDRTSDGVPWPYHKKLYRGRR